jgi:hypothetical protein
MKKNLFVLHTQYNLILATGLINTEFSDCQNDIILFKDFALTNELKKKIEQNYTDSIFLSGSYPKSNDKYIKKFSRYIKIQKELRRFMHKEYDNIFLVDDVCIPEMYIMKLAKRQNSLVKFSWLDDGTIAYFSNNVDPGGLSKNSFLKNIRKVIFKHLLRLKEFYHLDSCFGTHPLIKKLYVMFPLHVREELKNKETQEIKKISFEVGLQSIFSAYNKIIPQKSVIIILDMLSVYKDLAIVINNLMKLSLTFANMGYKVYYKYHPRETEELVGFNEKFEELDKSIAIESIYASINHSEVIVVGIKSTGLQTAQKLGYKTFSLIKMVENTESPILPFYEDIGIIQPTNLDGLLNNIRND